MYYTAMLQLNYIGAGGEGALVLVLSTTPNKFYTISFVVGEAKKMGNMGPCLLKPMLLNMPSKFLTSRLERVGSRL